MANLPLDDNYDGAHNLCGETSKKPSQLAESLQRMRMESDPSVPSSRLKIVIIMDEKFSVSLAFLNSVRQQICEFLPFLNQDAEFTARDLVGCAYWRALNAGERRIMGSCIRQLIKEGLPMSTVIAQNSQQAKYRFLGLAHQ